MKRKALLETRMTAYAVHAAPRLQCTLRESRAEIARAALLELPDMSARSRRDRPPTGPIGGDRSIVFARLRTHA